MEQAEFDRLLLRFAAKWCPDFVPTLKRRWREEGRLEHVVQQQNLLLEGPAEVISEDAT